MRTEGEGGVPPLSHNLAVTIFFFGGGAGEGAPLTTLETQFVAGILHHPFFLEREREQNFPTNIGDLSGKKLLR